MERQCIEDKNRLLTKITKLEEELSVMHSKVACIEKQAKEERDEFNRKLEDSITQARKHVSQQKDEERKLTIQQIQKQNEEDYKLFLEEHQNTLNQALSTSRELANKDKVRLQLHNLLSHFVGGGGFLLFCGNIMTEGSPKSGLCSTLLFIFLFVGYCN